MANHPVLLFRKYSRYKKILFIVSGVMRTCHANLKRIGSDGYLPFWEKQMIMKKGLMILSGCAMVILIMSCSKKDAVDTSPNVTDQGFLKNTSLANTAETNLANLAVTRAITPEVVSLARELITDNTRAQSELKSLAKTVNVAVADSIDAAHVALRQQLISLSGRAFDSVFLYSQVSDHDIALALFQQEIENGRSASIKAFANTYKPMVQTHRQDANNLATGKFPR
jgi:putative membrane protein